MTDKYETYRKADEFLATEDLGYNPRLKLRVTEIQNRRQSNDATGIQAIAVASGTTFGDLLLNDKLRKPKKIARRALQLANGG